MIRVSGPFAKGPLPPGRGSESDTPASRTHYTSTTATVDSCLPYDIPTVNDVPTPVFNPSSSLLTTCTSTARTLNHSISLHFSATTLATITNQAYPYTHDLLALARRSLSSQPPPLPPIEHFSSITTPLLQQAWAEALRNHPDPRLRDYLISGIQTGFRLGFDHACPLQSARANMQSALLNPEPVRDNLAKECAANRVLGPLPIALSSFCHVNHFGVIPKRRQPGKWRLILDLSFPPGGSVNDGIPTDLCSLQFTSVDNAASLITQLGQGSLLAKVDISHAYRNIPVHPQDRRLLGMSWDGALFIDTTLPFGLRSAPKVFCAVSDALEWILCNEGISSFLHYIDDFLTVGGPNSTQCSHNSDLLQAVCHRLGVPLAAENIEGPATVLSFLGIELDTERMVMCLPRDKLDHIQSVVAQWLGKKAATKREMLSDWRALPRLQSCCLIDLAHSRTSLNHWIHINMDFRSDLLWLHCFLERWNGQSLLMAHLNSPPAFTVFTDASGSWGCGAVWDHHWLQVQWSHSWLTTNIAAKELVAVVLALGVLGRDWANAHVLVRCDNMAVVEAITAKSCRDKLLMHMLRSIHFLCARHNIRVSAQHVPRVVNTQADALSRNNVKGFLLSLPKADPGPTPVPEDLLGLVVGAQPDWTCYNWRVKPRDFSTRA